MADDRDLIRSRIDILDLVGQSVRLKRAGKNWKGLCPFHQDKNPSFYVTPETGRYKCFSCGEGGDAFTWVMKTQNVEFGEALRILAKEAGVELSSRGPQVPPSVRLGQEAAMESALAFFRAELLRNEMALAYCQGRGLDRAALDSWEVGWAPDMGEALAIELKRLGHNLAECKSLFLVDGEPSFGYRDKFRSRLMFPIRDERGNLVAFGGRLLTDGHPKYINSGDTPLYRKSRVLYGLNKARERLNKDRRAILVEGYLDVVACHRAGVDGAVASLGTALSEDHAKLLKRWCDEVVILYDSDDAGRKAAERTAPILAAEGLKVRIALMPPGDDPDTLLRKAGPAAVRAAVETGLTPLDYQMQSLLQKRKPAEEEFWTEAVGHLAAAPTEMELDRWVVRLASDYPDVRDPIQAQRALRRWVARVRRNLQVRTPVEKSQVVVQHRPLPERLTSVELTVFAAFRSEQFRESGWLVAKNPALFTTELAVNLSEAIVAAFPDAPPQGPVLGWLYQIESEPMRQTLSDLEFDIRTAALTEEYVRDAVDRLERQQQEREVHRIKNAEGADEKYRVLMERLRSLKPDATPRKKADDSLF